MVDTNEPLREDSPGRNLKEEEAAALLGCSQSLLRSMRREGRGPRHTRVGRLVRYPENWIREYQEQNSEGEVTQ